MADLKRLRFFKIFLETQSEDRLRIPPAFRKHFKKWKLHNFGLIGPSRNVWRVTVTREEGSNEFYFERGWPRFVKDHSIDNGDLLIFNYAGQSNFKVKIFDKSVCPKKAAFSARPSQDAREAEKLKKGKSVKRDRRSFEVDGTSSGPNPHFSTTISISHLRLEYMNIPMRFARSNGLLDKLYVDLISPSGFRSTVGLKIADHQLSIGRGWHKFARSTGLKEGDICVFELLVGEEEGFEDGFAMAVHINEVPKHL